MQGAIELIVQNADRFPEFRYYIGIMEKAERNLTSQPDICIETCKSLLEGISKSIIERLDQTVERSALDSMTMSPLIKKAAQSLKKADNVIEDDFVTRCSSLAHALGVLRNERGDISHGKAVPKSKSSNDRLSTLCMIMTESVICYMLATFFGIEAKMAEELERKDEKTESSDLPLYSYEKNSDFNDWLDEKFPLEGRLIYSEALYQLYYEDYVIRLEAFRESPGDDQ